ncbi:hypothetical protein [Burkholderia sp. Ac-20365]|jgi:hypothetical protein|uniref:hypothetical protein n=1 Tax=Burkholderia sp. Ac-20365 TaxID=2703897 RepID=UPI00197B384A|nr:hypothetical protein [Burkholderia sp. Ac-20365]MBN3766779.1 hypothetical protein [Burkholderia sp. Ac-20365]
MQRRTFIAAGAWLSTTAAWPAVWRHPDALRAGLALIDTALPEASALSAHATRLCIPVIDLDAAPHADIAMLWYDTLAPRAGERLTMIGVARAADFFVLARLALLPAASMTHALSVPQRASVAFALTL